MTRRPVIGRCGCMRIDSGISLRSRCSSLAAGWVSCLDIKSETLRGWIERKEIDAGQRPGVPTAVDARIKALERENAELRRANEILKTASAFFAQAELDRRLR